MKKLKSLFMFFVSVISMVLVGAASGGYAVAAEDLSGSGVQDLGEGKGTVVKKNKTVTKTETIQDTD